MAFTVPKVDPYSGEITYELDYSDGVPYEGAPINPSTGVQFGDTHPYDPGLLPPGVVPNDPWDYEAGSWRTPSTGSSGTEEAPPPTGPPPPTPTPTPTPGVNPGSSSGSGSPSTFDISSSWPMLNLPRFDPGSPFQGPAPFSYDAFKAPTMDEARNEPGYAFAQEQGIGAMQNSAAAKGILRTGGMLKDLIGYGNRFAEQNYGNVYNRSANTYGMNRENAAENYRTNYGVSRDVFDRQYDQRKDKHAFDASALSQEFAPKERAASTTFNDIYRRWKDQLDSLTNIATAGAGG